MRAAPVLVLLSALGLAACQTPREACISEATSQLRTIDSLIRETRANLERGYAIEEDQEVRVRRGWCRVQNEDGTEGRVRCEDTDVVDVQRPVAIDLNAERAKLESLLEQRGRFQSQQDARLRACVAAYPE
jgi:hypothetical protein